MIFKKTEHKSLRPYLVVTVGALAMVGAYSIMKCGKRAARCACDKMSAMVKGVVSKSDLGFGAEL